MKILSPAVLALLTAGLLHPAHAARFWLAAEDPALARQKQMDVMADYMDLFAPGAPWQKAAQRLSVFKIFAQTVLFEPDDVLRTIFTDMRRRHIAVAIEMGAVLRTDECGGGEGFAPARLVDRVAGKLRRLGLVLDVWAMDEPVWFAHLASAGASIQGRPACMYPVAEVARRVAINVNRMRQYFPDIQVGTIDGVASTSVPGPALVRDNIAFADEFYRQTGRPLAFWHADIAWRNPDLRANLTALAKQLRARSIRFGAIVGGTPDQRTAAEWVSVALQHVRLLVDDPAVRPDDIVIQSWQLLPTRMLPEDQPDTVTYELLQAERIAG